MLDVELNPQWKTEHTHEGGDIGGTILGISEEKIKILGISEEKMKILGFSEGIMKILDDFCTGVIAGLRVIKNTKNKILRCSRTDMILSYLP